MDAKKVKFKWSKLKKDFTEVTYEDVKNEVVLWLSSHHKRAYLQFGENRETSHNKAIAKVNSILFSNDTEDITFEITPLKSYEDIILKSDFEIGGWWDIYEANQNGRTIQVELINCYIIRG